jgi:hypothetical protein
MDKEKTKDNTKNINLYLFLCDNKECHCHNILNDNNKLNDIITKKEKYICFKYYEKNLIKK